MKITRLTDTGNATAAAISPDGNYVVYAAEDNGKQSLRLRQVTSSTEREIVASDEVTFDGLTFSRDGNLIYYTQATRNNRRGTLYQLPTLGGTPRKVSERVFGAVGLSPDGKRLAFTRTSETAEHVDALIIANADGSDERTLTTKKGQDFLNDGPSWSPDGKTIVLGSGVEPDYSYESLLEIPVEGGKERWISSHKWSNVYRAVWLADGSALVVVARESGYALAEGSQIWLVYPGAEARTVTNDLNSYLTRDTTSSPDPSLGLTADSSTLIALQEDTSSRIWVTTTNADDTRANEITNGKFDGIHGVSWTPDGKILWRAGNQPEIWLMNADGREKKPLTADGFAKGRPEMSPDGRYIVFFSDHSGSAYRIWRMDADGSNQKQLTNGNGEFAPKFTPDGQWVIFWSWEWSGTPRLGKVSIDGGESVQLTNYDSRIPDISPDGKLIAAGHANETAFKTQLLIIPAEGGPPLKSFDLPIFLWGAGLAWMRDGKAVAYVDTHEGVSNIWSQPIDGGSPQQLTRFKSDRIFSFGLSPDGRQLVLARGTQTRDVVLIRDFR